MRIQVAALAAALVAGGLPGSAHALMPMRHQEMSARACARAGLPPAFCVRVGVDAHDVDRHEWDDQTSHAQRTFDVSLCEAAQRAEARAAELGAELRAAMLAWSNGADAGARAARALGRALHLVQDNCAHEGMSDQQHAFLSSLDVCDHRDQGPDSRPAAIACAEQVTERVVADAVAPLYAALRQHRVARGGFDPGHILDGSGAPVRSSGDVLWAGRTGDELGVGLCRAHNEDEHGSSATCRPVLPSLSQACAFLGGAWAWDRVDRRWDVDRVSAWLEAAFTAALAARPLQPEDRCADGDGPLEVPPDAPEAAWPTGSQAAPCPLVALACGGKSDGASRSLAEALFVEAPSAGSGAGGCSIGPSAAGVAGAAWPLLLLVGPWRRHRARHGSRPRT